VNKRTDKVSARPVSVFGQQTWSTAIATAWVLSRNRQFTEACSRSNFPDDYVIEGEAEEWKRASTRPRDQSGRKPVMLFPSVTAACQNLVGTLGTKPDKSAAPDVNDIKWVEYVKSLKFHRAAVLESFPDLDDRDRERLLASVWRGDDPHKHARIPFSHAAWWIASDHGTRPVTLDDVVTWRAGFERILEQVAKGLTILALDPPPARAISPSEFDSVPIEYPCAALARSPYRGGRDSHIACTIDSERGDRYFEKGNSVAKWLRLMVQSAELLKIRNTASLKSCSLDDYKKHVEETVKKTGYRPSGEADEAWAKNNDYSTTSVRVRRKEFTDALPREQQEAAKRGGPRRPHLKP
jgi:hypothetical protein